MASFEESVAPIAAWLEGRSVGPDLGDELARVFPPTGAEFRALAAACREGVADGSLANRGDEPLKWGRAIKASPDSHGLSVDVVRMTDVAGPRHAHPNGEIDMILPIDPDATFDGHGEGWLVYSAGSVHAPTVSGGSAIILYLLPDGAIDFSAPPSTTDVHA